METVVFVPLGASILSLLFVCYLTASLLKKDRGSDKMIEISNSVQDGAKAFLKREYMYVSIFCAVIAILICVAGVMKPESGMGWRLPLLRRRGFCSADSVLSFSGPVCSV